MHDALAVVDTCRRLTTFAELVWLPQWLPRGNNVPGLRTAQELTVALIEKIPRPPEGQRPVYWDALVPGLGLRVYPSGRKVWIVQYRVRGGSRTAKRYTIGPYGRLQGQVSLASARDQARGILARAAAGEDPQSEVQARRESPTVEWLAGEYLEKYAKPRKRSWRRDAQILRADVIPVWGKRRAADIRRRDVVDLLDAIKNRGAPIQANRALACVRKLYNWAIGRDLVEHNPCLAVSAPAKESQRDRVLTDGELRAIWHALDGEGMLIASMFRLHLLTAQRGGEVRQMRWVDVDLVSGWWTIPAEIAKNRLSHRVPLAQPAIAILRELREKTGDGEWVLPGRVDGQPLLNPYKALARIKSASGVDFVPHDLRRTAASVMASLGVPRLVISKVLNHVEQGVTRVYDRHSYDQEKRKALDVWAERLMAVVG